MPEVVFIKVCRKDISVMETQLSQLKKDLKKIITIIGINYYPEDTAIGLYTSQLSNFYNDIGMEVNVITGFPYYPSWRIRSDYKLKKTFFYENIK